MELSVNLHAGSPDNEITGDVEKKMAFGQVSVLDPQKREEQQERA